MAERVSVHCPTKKEDLEVVEPFPAWEICPVCQNPFGKNRHRECFFTIRKISEDQPREILILAVAV